MTGKEFLKIIEDNSEKGKNINSIIPMFKDNINISDVFVKKMKHTSFVGSNIELNSCVFLESYIGDTFRESSKFENSLFYNCSLSKVLFEGVMKDCKFINCNFFESMLNGIVVENCLFYNCDFSAVDFSYCEIFDTEFIRSKNVNQNSFVDNIEYNVKWE